MAMELKHLNPQHVMDVTGKAIDEISRLRAENAELKAQKAQAEDDCAYWKMREGNAVNAMHETEEACMFLTKSERHQKYKRCLAMASLSLEKRETYRAEYEEWCLKWYKRWLELAEKFKPNSTAQQGKG